MSASNFHQFFPLPGFAKVEIPPGERLSEMVAKTQIMPESSKVAISLSTLTLSIRGDAFIPLAVKRNRGFYH